MQWSILVVSYSRVKVCTIREFPWEFHVLLLTEFYASRNVCSKWKTFQCGRQNAGEAGNKLVGWLAEQFAICSQQFWVIWLFCGLLANLRVQLIYFRKNNCTVYYFTNLAKLNWFRCFHGFSEWFRMVWDEVAEFKLEWEWIRRYEYTGMRTGIHKCMEMGGGREILILFPHTSIPYK